MKRDGEVKMSKLLCGLTSLPLAKPSSITPDAGPSCLKPHVSAHSPKRFPGGRAGRMKEASLHPPDWPHVACRGSAVTTCLTHVREDTAAPKHSTISAG